MLTLVKNSTEQELQHALHSRLLRLNGLRLNPGYIETDWQTNLREEYAARLAEGCFIEQERMGIQNLLVDVPEEPLEFVNWFETLKQTGPGQSDRLFPWLADKSSRAEMYWFLTQESAGEAGFEDLVALAQLKLPPQAKLEMARNYWDEMGRGHERGMHGLLLSAVVTDLKLNPAPGETVWESLALANLMAGLAANRRYAYQAIGALGAIEMTAPSRVTLVNDGLIRLNVPATARTYFQLHAGLDIKHSAAWNTEVLFSLVKNDSRNAIPIAEGALMRLTAGARCFERYRSHLGIS